MKVWQLAIIIIFFTTIVLTPWVINAKKLFYCDFEYNYRCEAIHGAGLLIPPISFITVWFDDDSKKEVNK